MKSALRLPLQLCWSMPWCGTLHQSWSTPPSVHSSTLPPPTRMGSLFGTAAGWPGCAPSLATRMRQVAHLSVSLAGWPGCALSSATRMRQVAHLLSVCLSVCLPSCLPARPSVHPSVRRTSVRLPVCSSVRPSSCLSVCLSCPSICLAYANDPLRPLGSVAHDLRFRVLWFRFCCLGFHGLGSRLYNAHTSELSLTCGLFPIVIVLIFLQLRVLPSAVFAFCVL
jgi:hypothetical protein